MTEIAILYVLHFSGHTEEIKVRPALCAALEDARRASRAFGEPLFIFGPAGVKVYVRDWRCETKAEAPSS